MCEWIQYVCVCVKGNVLFVQKNVWHVVLLWKTNRIFAFHWWVREGESTLFNKRLFWRRQKSLRCNWDFFSWLGLAYFNLFLYCDGKIKSTDRSRVSLVCCLLVASGSHMYEQLLVGGSTRGSWHFISSRLGLNRAPHVIDLLHIYQTHVGFTSTHGHRRMKQIYLLI